MVVCARQLHGSVRKLRGKVQMTCGVDGIMLLQSRTATRRLTGALCLKERLVSCIDNPMPLFNPKLMLCCKERSWPQLDFRPCISRRNQGAFVTFNLLSKPILCRALCAMKMMTMQHEIGHGKLPESDPQNQTLTFQLSS